MKLKHIDMNDHSLRDVWSTHEVARRDVVDRKRQNRLKMLMGPIEERQDPAADQAIRWW